MPSCLGDRNLKFIGSTSLTFVKMTERRKCKRLVVSVPSRSTVRPQRTTVPRSSVCRRRVHRSAGNSVPQGMMGAQHGLCPAFPSGVPSPEYTCVDMHCTRYRTVQSMNADTSSNPPSSLNSRATTEQMATSRWRQARSRWRRADDWKMCLHS